MTDKDFLFSDDSRPVKPFEFNESVAGVFDDMANRSIPYYGTVQKMVVELTTRFVQPGSSIYDLGCSTGTTLHDLLTVIDSSLLAGGRIVGIDS